MTILDLLRCVASAGLGLARERHGLRVYGHREAYTDRLRRVLAEHKAMLLPLLGDHALRARLHIPADAQVDPVLTISWLWLDTERRAFTQSERHLWLKHLQALVAAGQPNYAAVLEAANIVVRARQSFTGSSADDI
jgi:hypothetical protein